MNILYPSMLSKNSESVTLRETFWTHKLSWVNFKSDQVVYAVLLFLKAKKVMLEIDLA